MSDLLRVHLANLLQLLASQLHCWVMAVEPVNQLLPVADDQASLEAVAALVSRNVPRPLAVAPVVLLPMDVSQVHSELWVTSAGLVVTAAELDPRLSWPTAANARQVRVEHVGELLGCALGQIELVPVVL